jgi:NADPH:quinone reductase-like Zn-dependent oxidoreductase
MWAAVIHERGGQPRVEDFAEPAASAGEVEIVVAAGSIGPTDLMRVNGVYGAFEPPIIAGSEGVGRLADGSRVYFGHSRAPYGAWAERTVVDADEVWRLPDDIDDGQAIALAISGTGALIPLEEARIAPGERVLILGATGPLGQIAPQLARVLGAGVVVGAARNPEALARLEARGIADETVQLGTGDDVAALKAVAGDGYDVVLDAVFGKPAEAALQATRFGARMMSIGVQAGATMTVNLRDLIFRTHAGVGTGQRPAAERKAAFERLIALGRAGKVTADTTTFSLDEAAQAWAAQGAISHSKVIVTV